MTNVTIIIPTYNRAHTIMRCITSVLQQDYTDFEVIVVDDRSTDETVNVVSKIQDSRVRLVENARSKGSGGARNTGILKAAGKYIAFLDSDDEWLSSKLRLQVEALENASLDCGGVYTAGYVYKNGNQTNFTLKAEFYSGRVLKELLLGQFSPLTSSMMFRASCFEEVGLFDESLLRHQDIDMWVRLFINYRISLIKEPLVKMHLITNKAVAYETAKAKFIIVNRYRSVVRKFGWYSERLFLSQSYMSLSILFFREREYFKGSAYFIRAMLYTPMLPFRVYLSALFGIYTSFVKPSREVWFK